MRKKLKSLVVIIGLVMLLAAAIIFNHLTGKKPFRHLRSSDIKSATVQLTPPDVIVEVEDINKLAELLQDIVIYKKDNSYTEYCGQSVMFTIELNDGICTKITAYNPFVIIDGVGYKCEYGSCEALSVFGNRLLDEVD